MCKVQGKKSSHILKISPIALTYSRILGGLTDSKRSFMFLTHFFHVSEKTASYISEFDTVNHDMLNCQWAGTSDTWCINLVAGRGVKRNEI